MNVDKDITDITHLLTDIQPVNGDWITIRLVNNYYWNTKRNHHEKPKSRHVNLEYEEKLS